jgi:hypothetical protein
MIITYKKGIKIEQNPTMLYGYGGFNVSLTPVLALLMRCGWKTDVYAVTKFKVVVNMEKNGMMQELKCKTKCI